MWLGKNCCRKANGPLVLNTLSFKSTSAQNTRQLAGVLAAFFQVGDVVLLSGSLGAGKTTFMKGVAEGLGICDPVTSPTFALAHHYRVSEAEVGAESGHTKSKLAELRHIDLYRLSHPQEMLDYIWEELEQAAVFVEWGERLLDEFPDNRLEIKISFEAIADSLEASEQASDTSASDTPAPDISAPDTRVIELAAVGHRWSQVWKDLATATAELAASWNELS